MSQPDLQTIAIHVLPNISAIRNDQKMKLVQLIDYSKINILLQKSCRNEAGRLV